MFQSVSECLTIIKQNLGIRDLPKPVTDEDLQWRLVHSALKEFDQRYPYTARFLIGDSDRVCKPYVGVPTNHTNSYSQVYQIPKHYYQEQKIIEVTEVIIQRPNGYNDLYVPQGMIGNPIQMMMGMASIQLAGAMAAQMTHSLTWNFRAPDILILYNGWTGGNYEIELAMTHDPSLSTIPPGAMSSFLQLAELDIAQYLYQKLKRIQNFDVGVGSIELKIDDWADAERNKRDLLREWDEACALDVGHIQYW